MLVNGLTPHYTLIGVTDKTESSGWSEGKFPRMKQAALYVDNLFRDQFVYQVLLPLQLVQVTASGYRLAIVPSDSSGC